MCPKEQPKDQYGSEPLQHLIPVMESFLRDKEHPQRQEKQARDRGGKGLCPPQLPPAPPHPGTTVLPSCKNTPKVVTILLVLSGWERKCKHLCLRGVLEVKTPLVKPLVQCPAYSKCSINESS